MQRFAIGRSWQAADGLWMAEAQRLPADPTLPPEPDVQACARALGEAIEALKGQGDEPFLVPHMLDDASWVANRWCEILPIAAAAKQQLMMLNDPMARLRLVDRFLREQGVIG
jgi:Lon protease-like protein